MQEPACQSYSFGGETQECLFAYARVEQNRAYLEEDDDFDTFDLVRL